MKEQLNIEKTWYITRYQNEEDYKANMPSGVVDPNTGEYLQAVSKVEGNLMLNEGITALLNLLTGETETAFDEVGSFLGVGDSNTAESAAQTGLQAVTNKLYKAMESGYPQISGQTVTWRAVFASGDANFNWREFTVANGNSDSGDNLNRKVSDQGTKASGQVWTCDLVLTVS